MSDESLEIGDWIPEIIAVLIVGGVYSLLVYRWFAAELNTMGTLFLWLGFIVALSVLFGWDAIEDGLDVLKK